MLPRVLQLRPTTSCPARCATCTTLVTSEAADLSLDEIAANLAHFVARHGVDELVFSGAEITARADLEAIVELVRGYPFRLVTLISTGLMWTDQQLAACQGTIDRVVVGLTPERASEWRSLTGRVARVRKNVVRLTEAGLRVQSNTVLVPGSVAVIDEIAGFIERQRIEQPTFSFPFASGGAAAVRASGVPVWGNIEAAVSRVMSRLAPLGPRLKNVPPCAALKLARFAPRTSERILVERGRQLEAHGLVPPFIGMRFADACSSCALRSHCDGYWPAHVEAGVLPEPVAVAS